MSGPNRSIPALFLALLAPLAALCAPVFATPTGLNFVPTTDVVGRSGYTLQFELDGRRSPFSSGRSAYVLSEVGLSDRVEAGADLFEAFDGSTLVVDAKYLLVPPDEGKVALAAGCYNLGRGLDAVAYATGTARYRELRLHAGLARTGGRYYLQGGFDLWSDTPLWLLADHTGGSNNYTTVGLYYEPTETVGFTLYAGHHHSDSEENFVGLNVAYWGSFRGPG